jgi:hypothetical protein
MLARIPQLTYRPSIPVAQAFQSPKHSSRPSIPVAQAFQSPNHSRMLLWRFAGKIPSRAVDLGCYESGHGTLPTSGHVRLLVAIAGKADIGSTDQNRRE